jgi:uncharacterized membrane protein HdeD (DUF308 family)
MLIAGIFAMIAGFMIIAQLSSFAVWATGLLVGVSTTSLGGAYFSLALDAGKTA